MIGMKDQQSSTRLRCQNVDSVRQYRAFPLHNSPLESTGRQIGRMHPNLPTFTRGTRYFVYTFDNPNLYLFLRERF